MSYGIQKDWFMQRDTTISMYFITLEVTKQYSDANICYSSITQINT